MDPEARVVVTATNETDAAFRSADKNLQQFQRTARNMRGLLASFGVVFSARAFLSWIDGAVKAADATGEYAETVKATKDTLEAMKKASDSLALSVATSLVPAMQGLTAVFTGWNRLISGSDPFEYEAQLEKLRNTVGVLKAQLGASGGMPKSFLDGLQAEIDDTNKKIDELIQKQRKALGLDMGPEFRQDVQMRQALEGMKRIGDAYDKFTGLKRPNIELEELVPLDGLEDIVVSAREMTVDELLKPFPSAEVARMFEPIKEEGSDAAAFLGSQFQDAFAGWLVGADRGFKDLLKRMAAELATSAIFKGIGTLFGGASGGAKGFFANFFGGPRAEGGPVSAGRGYLVGERGPELFVPGMSGGIVPNGGASFSFSTTIDARGADSSLAARLPAILEARDRQLMNRIKDLSSRQRF